MPSPAPEKVKVLFLAALPYGEPNLALDEEVRAIQEEIRAAEFRDALEVCNLGAVRPRDLRRALNQHRPRIVHFSCHGTEAAELILMDDEGNRKPVPKDALADLFQVLKGQVRLVFLNACFSKPQAEAIARVIDCAVGMGTALKDQAGIVFAASFYGALAYGASVGKAFDQARATLPLEGIPEQDTPQLVPRAGVDPYQLFIVQPPAAPRNRRLLAFTAAGALAAVAAAALFAFLARPAPGNRTGAEATVSREAFDPGVAPVSFSSAAEAFDHIADKVAGQLKRQDESSVCFAGIRDLTPEQSNQGPGIVSELALRLRKRGIRVAQGDQSPSLAGLYDVRDLDQAPLDKLRATGVVLQVSLYPAGSDTPTSRHLVHVHNPPLAARYRGDVLDDLGPTPSIFKEVEAVERAKAGKAVPVIDPSGVKASLVSPYSLRVKVTRRGVDVAAPIVLRDGKTWVGVAKGDALEVELGNAANHAVAVELTVDGVNVFALGSRPDLSWVHVPPRQKRVVRGWYDLGPGGAGTVEGFVVTEYARSVAGQLKRTTNLGIISACFHAAWSEPSGKPDDEDGESRHVGGYNIGRGDKTAVTGVVHQMQIGRCRASLHVRYDAGN